MNALADRYGFMGLAPAYAVLTDCDRFRREQLIAAEWQATVTMPAMASLAASLSEIGELPAILIGPNALWEFLACRAN